MNKKQTERGRKKRRKLRKAEVKKRERGSKRKRGMEERRKSRGEERSLWIQYRCRVLIGNTVLLASTTGPTPMIHHLVHYSLLAMAGSGPPRPSAVGALIGVAEYFIRYHTYNYCRVPVCILTLLQNSTSTSTSRVNSRLCIIIHWGCGMLCICTMDI